MIRGLLVYTALAIFCALIWTGAVVMIVRYGWIGGAAIIVTLLAVYEVVFDAPFGTDEVARPSGRADSRVWDDEAAA